MIHDTASRCTLCDRLVLGLAGHDWTVLPWMVAPGSGALPGPCHVRCLADLECASAWASAVEAYHCKRWPLWLAGVDAGVHWRLHSSRSARQFHLWRSDGRLISFPYAVLTAGPVRLTTDLAEVGTAHAATLLRAMGTDADGVDVPLAYVITALDLSDRYPRLSGTVTRDLRGESPDAADVVTARHPLPLPPACRRAAGHLMRTPW
ncbi:hypothetical protein ACIA5D_13835 [Actinoplanes sp. NPDC051513]|uniref:hypothetical protein n=1 Tax=Actinoplanes sp. NPDC051513 TaxID=3363908 RepID=UPI00379A0E83